MNYHGELNELVLTPVIDRAWISYEAPGLTQKTAILDRVHPIRIDPVGSHWKSFMVADIHWCEIGFEDQRS